MATKGIYTGSTIRPASSVVFGFGSSTTNTIADARSKPTGEKVTHSPSTSKVFSGGTANYFGNVITYLKTGTINGLANSGFGVPANYVKDENHTLSTVRLHKITAVNGITGKPTYHASEGEAYSLYGTDVEVSTRNSPYAVPPKLSYLMPLKAQTSNYSISGVN